MVKYEETIELESLPNELREDIIEKAVAGTIKLYGVSCGVNAQLIPLHSGQVQKIKSEYPDKVIVRIISDYNNLGNLYPSPAYAEGMLSNGMAIKISKNELRICKSDLNKLESASLCTSSNSISQEEKISLLDSPYWNALEELCLKAIKAYPSWKASRISKHKIKKTSELKEFIKAQGANDREAHVVARVLADKYEELR